MFNAGWAILFHLRLLQRLLALVMLLGLVAQVQGQESRLAQGLVNQKFDSLHKGQPGKKAQPGFGWKGGWVLSKEQPALFVDA